jgi:DNA-binding GntR family transcriptional regulator
MYFMKSGLHEQAANQLRQMLMEGRLPVGGKLNERELSVILNVSRTPLREAIKMLAAEGLVELLPNRGAIVPDINAADVSHTFEVMAHLEGQSGELAAQRITEGELAEIKALHYEMLACFVRRDIFNYYRLNSSIHSAINAAAKNPVLTDTYKKMNARLHTLRFKSNQDEAKWQAAVNEHEKMIEALVNRDATGLRTILIAHLNSKRDVVLGQLSNIKK